MLTSDWWPSEIYWSLNLKFCMKPSFGQPKALAEDWSWNEKKMHQPNRHWNIGQNTSSGTNDAFLSFRSSIHFHILYFDLRKKEVQVTWMGVSNLGIARENTTFLLMSSLWPRLWLSSSFPAKTSACVWSWLLNYWLITRSSVSLLFGYVLWSFCM